MYRLSDGSLIQKRTIDHRIIKAKKQYTDIICERLHISENKIVCERCKLNNNLASGVSRSRIISVDYAQKTGRSELAYDILNLEHLCLKDHRELENLPNHIREQWYEYRKEKIMAENEMPELEEFLKIICYVKKK